MLELIFFAYAYAVLAILLCLSVTAHNSIDTRYVILDSTHDSPSVTALLMALELSSKPDSNIKFLGAITTETPELEHLRQILDLSDLSRCLPIISVEENDLYPVYGDTVQIPDTVQFLLDQVAKYPGQVSIYSSGSLAAVAMADNIDPSFASNVGEVMIVGNIYAGASDFAKDKRAEFMEDSPFLRDQEAFLQLLGGDIPLVRIMATSKPVLSGKAIADRVLAAVKADSGDISDFEALSTRPLAELYLRGHRSRMLAGHDQAILMQEPGAAVLFDSRVIAKEAEVEFVLQPSLHVVQIGAEEVDPGDRSTLIYEIDEDKFWDLLVRVRSKDWSEFCTQSEMVASTEGQHDEL